MASKIINFVSFIKQTIKNPQINGAVAPSSKKLALLIVKEANLNTSKTIVEIGPGNGIFTGEILKRIKKKNKFFVIEINDFFVNELKNKYPDLLIFHDTAENIDKCLKTIDQKKCDRVISGLPWTAFDEKMQKDIITKIYNSLEIGGMFLTFSYFPLNNLPDGKNFKNILESFFKEVKKTKVVSNFPPAFVYICIK
ncbi:MAG: SAM-dependent methyltransferase [Candidatus Nomurabacteria bacterium]|nr:SAM-dependent methyltransferase [Candidatus Nomurabacteria bacterium]